MYSSVAWISQRVAESFSEPAPGAALISIATPSYPEPKLKPELWGSILRVDFHDIDHQYSDPYDRPYVLFNEEHAEKIIDFVVLNSHLEQLVAHCWAGISRSAAVAKFVADIYGLNLEDQAYQGRSHHNYNRHVYSTLMNVYHGKSKGASSQ